MIVEWLIKIQETRNLTDDHFAQSLGIHRVSWVRNKRTKVISSDTLLKALEVYPELKEKFLSSFVKGGDKEVTTATITPSQPHQDRRGGVFAGVSIIQYLVSLVKRLKKPTK